MEKEKYERPEIQRLNTGMMNKFGTKTETTPKTHIDEVPVKEILAQYGSPVFVLSEKQIRKKYKYVYKAFSTRYPKVQFAWSYKTNYLNAICNIFHQEGSWAEVVSGFEYDKAILNKVPGNKIIFNGPDKSDEDLKKAIQNHSMIHIDHLDELYSINHLTEEMDQSARVAIRVNMDTGIHPLWDRFGFNYETGQAWDAINKIMHSEKLRLVGLHCHIGTYMMTTQAYSEAARKLTELAIRIKSHYNHQIHYLDLGGGFPSNNNLKGAYLPGADLNPTMDEFAEAISSSIMNSGFGPNELPTLILESGRALVDEAGYLLGTVLANKRLANGRRATILDFGVNLLFTSYWFNHKISPAQEFNQYMEDMELFGPLCMNIDIIRESITLPLLKKGDHVVVHHVGAYNLTQWMQFITLRPHVVLIGMDGKTHLIRKAETIEYINSQEMLPEHLKTFAFHDGEPAIKGEL